MIPNNGGESVRRTMTAFMLRHLPLIVLVPVLAGGCGTVSYLADPSYLKNYPVDKIEAPNPGLDGPYKYRTYFYGSGADKRRTEYGRTVDFKTEPVDASAFMDIFDSVPGYWGFDLDRLPINGRVWFPEGPEAPRRPWSKTAT